MSSAKTRAFGSRSSSMSRRTLSSFWNEHASATLGWSASSIVSMTLLARQRLDIGLADELCDAPLHRAERYHS